MAFPPKQINLDKLIHFRFSGVVPDCWLYSLPRKEKQRREGLCFNSTETYTHGEKE
ncbi:DNA-directed RNA polymerase subunit beta, partial [Clarias magur]